jgi:hypothetical protein
MPTSQSSPAFLSVRLPQATRDRLKVAAAARGETMQGLVGSLVERFLAEGAQGTRSRNRPRDAADPGAASEAARPRWAVGVRLGGARRRAR